MNNPVVTTEPRRECRVGKGIVGKNTVSAPLPSGNALFMMTSEEGREWRKGDDRKITQPSGGKRNERTITILRGFSAIPPGFCPAYGERKIN